MSNLIKLFTGGNSSNQFRDGVFEWFFCVFEWNLKKYVGVNRRKEKEKAYSWRQTWSEYFYINDRCLFINGQRWAEKVVSGHIMKELLC